MNIECKEKQGRGLCLALFYGEQKQNYLTTSGHLQWQACREFSKLAVLLQSRLVPDFIRIKEVLQNKRMTMGVGE